MSDSSEFFTELLYGSGALLGALIVICIVVVVSAYEKKAGVPLFFLTLFFTISYLQNIAVDSNFMWLSLLMFFVSLFLLYRVFKK